MLGKNMMKFKEIKLGIERKKTIVVNNFINCKKIKNPFRSYF